jgi:hypothetical protein
MELEASASRKKDSCFGAALAGVVPVTDFEPPRRRSSRPIERERKTW